MHKWIIIVWRHLICHFAFAFSLQCERTIRNNNMVAAWDERSQEGQQSVEGDQLVLHPAPVTWHPSVNSGRQTTRGKSPLPPSPHPPTLCLSEQLQPNVGLAADPIWSECWITGCRLTNLTTVKLHVLGSSLGLVLILCASVFSWSGHSHGVQPKSNTDFSMQKLHSNTVQSPNQMLTSHCKNCTVTRCRVQIKCWMLNA